MLEQTLVLFKPDAVQRGLVGEILMRFERAGLRIAGMKLVWVDS
ncbi:MAG: nucleoside-diphosphate kinase, partial [Chloroflexales bacterium]